MQFDFFRDTFVARHELHTLKIIVDDFLKVNLVNHKSLPRIAGVFQDFFQCLIQLENTCLHHVMVLMNNNRVLLILRQIEQTQDRHKWCPQIMGDTINEAIEFLIDLD
jgi:hypothetical protein